MSDVTISYKGDTIATMDASGTKTILTEGKYCEDDIEVVYVKPGGGGGSKQEATGTVTGDGTTTLQIPCAFAPDEIYLCVFGEDVTNPSFRGVISICILKNHVLYFTQDSSSSAVTETMAFCKHSITGYNEADTSNPHASYANGIITIDTITNSSGYRFASGATYKYYLCAYSSS